MFTYSTSTPESLHLSLAANLMLYAPGCRAKQWQQRAIWALPLPAYSLRFSDSRALFGLSLEEVIRLLYLNLAHVQLGLKEAAAHLLCPGQQLPAQPLVPPSISLLSSQARQCVITGASLANQLGDEGIAASHTAGRW